LPGNRGWFSSDIYVRHLVSKVLKDSNSSISWRVMAKHVQPTIGARYWRVHIICWDPFE